MSERTAGITIAERIKQAFPAQTVTIEENSQLKTVVLYDTPRVQGADLAFDSIDKPILSPDRQHFLAVGTKDQTKTLMRDRRTLLQGNFANMVIFYPDDNLQNFFVSVEKTEENGRQSHSLYRVWEGHAKAIMHGVDEIRRANILKSFESPIKMFVSKKFSKQSVHYIDSQGNIQTPVTDAQSISFPKVENSYDPNLRVITSTKDDIIQITVTDINGQVVKQIQVPSQPDRIELNHVYPTQEITVLTRHQDGDKVRLCADGWLADIKDLDPVEKKQTPQIEEIKWQTTAARKALKFFGSPLFRSEIITSPEKDVISEFVKLLQEGYGGVIIIKHFSLRDPVQVAKDVVLKNPALSKRYLNDFVARHQGNKLVQWLGRLLEMRFTPIETDRSRADAKKKGKPVPPRNDGLTKASAEILQTLAHGGLFVFTPEGTRKNHLNQYDKKPVGTFLARAKRAGVKTAYLIVDLRRAGVEQGYWDKEVGPKIGFKKLSFYPLNLFDFHPQESYETRIYKVITDDQLLQASNGQFANIDQTVWQLMVEASKMERAA